MPVTPSVITKRNGFSMFEPNTRQHPFSRRMFTATTAAAFSGAMVHSSRATADEQRELRLGIIGCGGRGTGAINNSLSINSGVRLVATAAAC